MGYWLKSYTDILDDPKYHRMSERSQLAMHEIFLVAKAIEGEEHTGLVPCVDDIAFYTRRSVEFWVETLSALLASGIISEVDNGYLIKNYVKRQRAIPDIERAKQYRKRRNDAVMETETDKSQECHDSLITRDGEKRREDTDTDTEKEKEKIDIGNNHANFYVEFQEKLGLPLMGGKDIAYLDDLLEENGGDKILEIAEWLKTRDPEINSMWKALRAIDTASRNWSNGKKSNGKVDIGAVLAEMMEDTDGN